MLKNSFPPTALMPQVQTSTLYEVYKLTSRIYRFGKRHLAQNRTIPLIQISRKIKDNLVITNTLWVSYQLCLCSEYLDLGKCNTSNIQRQAAFCSVVLMKVLRIFFNIACSLYFPFFGIRIFSPGNKPKQLIKIST